MILVRGRAYAVTIKGKGETPITVRLQYCDTAYHRLTHEILTVFKDENWQEITLRNAEILEISHTLQLGFQKLDVNDPANFKPFPPLSATTEATT